MTQEWPKAFNRKPQELYYRSGDPVTDSFGLPYFRSHDHVRTLLLELIDNGSVTADYRKFQEAALAVGQLVPAMGEKVHDNCLFPWTAAELPHEGQTQSTQQQLNTILREYIGGRSAALQTMATQTARQVFGVIGAIDRLDINELAKQLASKVTAELLGLPSEHMAVMQAAVAEYETRTGSFDWLNPPTAEYEMARDALFSSQRDQPGLVRELSIRHERGEISLEQRNALLWGGYAAAYGTTASGISLVALNIFDFGLESAVQEADNLPAWVAEAMRLTPPMVAVPLAALKRFTLGGVTVEPGGIVFASLQGANLDPDIFPDPLAFRPERENVLRHSAYGGGRHTCLGRHLADAVMIAALQAMVEQRLFTNYRLHTSGRNWNLVDVMTDLTVVRV